MKVTRSVDTSVGQLSPQERSTVEAIVKARLHILNEQFRSHEHQVYNKKISVMYYCHCSNYPLSIVLVGVGDGPWHMMQKFDDNIPARAFDNIQVRTGPSSILNPCIIHAQLVELCGTKPQYFSCTNYPFSFKGMFRILYLCSVTLVSYSIIDLQRIVFCDKTVRHKFTVVIFFFSITVKNSQCLVEVTFILKVNHYKSVFYLFHFFYCSLETRKSPFHRSVEHSLLTLQKSW